jgi:hypothetical protein
VTVDYAEFLASKAQFDGATGVEPVWMSDRLMPFQHFVTEWGLRMGRAAFFQDCGLGKTLEQLVWAENVYRITGKPVLIFAPLGVTHQTVAEAAKFGIEAAVSRDGRVAAGITVTNYDRQHLFDRRLFGGAVGDESSAIKAFDGVLRAAITEFMREMPFRLLCTATAAPNDYVELGTSSEALGHLGHMDMLARFFTNNQRTSAMSGGKARGKDAWRFKGHAEQPFWRWVASWARAMRRPSDLGFSDEGFELPPLEYRQHVVAARTRAEGMLFDFPAVGLAEEREEQRRTLTERCEKAAEILSDADAAVAWCNLNDEGDLLAELIPGSVQVSGSDDPHFKEEALVAFGRGEIRVLVTKPMIAGWGLNWQHCHRMTYFPTHSYERLYQPVRRCWRFGQKHPVTVDIVTTEGGAGTLRNLERKAALADRMFDSLVEHMRDALSIRRSNPFDTRMEVPAWLTY